MSLTGLVKNIIGAVSETVIRGLAGMRFLGKMLPRCPFHVADYQNAICHGHSFPAREYSSDREVVLFV